MERIYYTTGQNRYAEYERESSSSYLRKSITGSSIGCGKCVGYCQFRGHSGFLTREQRSQHNCIGKGCFYYLEKPKQEKEHKNVASKQSFDIMSIIQESVTSEAIRIIRVTITGDNKATAFFVAITNDTTFTESTKQIKENYGVDVTFTKLDYGFDTCVKLLYYL